MPSPARPAPSSRVGPRYPTPRVPRPVLVGLIAAAVAVALSWLVWAALHHARPAVAAQVTAYAVVSDTEMSVTFSVDRRDPGTPVTCQVIAQAPDFQRVAEQQVAVRGDRFRVVDVTVSLTTLRRATSASVTGCRLG